MSARVQKECVNQKGQYWKRRERWHSSDWQAWTPVHVVVNFLVLTARCQSTMMSQVSRSHVVAESAGAVLLVTTDASVDNHSFRSLYFFSIPLSISYRVLAKIEECANNILGGSRAPSWCCFQSLAVARSNDEQVRKLLRTTNQTESSIGRMDLVNCYSAVSL